MLFDKMFSSACAVSSPNMRSERKLDAAAICALQVEERDGLLCPLQHHLGRADVPSEGGRGREARHDYPSDRGTLRLGVSQGTAWKLSRRYSGER